MKIVAVLLAVVFFVAAALYFTGHLQLFAHDAGVHTKHGAVSLVLAVLALVWLRFLSASAPAPSR